LIISQAGLSIAIESRSADTAISFGFVVALGLLVALMGVGLATQSQSGGLCEGLGIVGRPHVLLVLNGSHFEQPDSGNTQVGAFAQETGLQSGNGYINT